MAASLARQFFEKAVAGGSSFLKNLITEQTPETEWLDFKGADHLDEKETKVSWSRSICGFANNEGGVIVWGIDARFDKTTKIDVASALAMTPNPLVLRDRLRQLHPGATDPPLGGVESVEVFESGGGGPGFVISFVPESDIKPHRAELVEGKPYFLRIGDSFHNPSPSILRNLFFPGSSARLQVGLKPYWTSVKYEGGTVSRQIAVRYDVVIKNTSNITAKEIYVIVEPANPNAKVESAFIDSKAELDAGAGIAFPRAVHPLSTAAIGAIHCNSQAAVNMGETILPHEGPFVVNFRVFATDMLPVNATVTVSDDDRFHKTRVWGTSPAE